jgi:hypothetical protein
VALEACTYRSPENHRYVFKAVRIPGPAKNRNKSLSNDSSSTFSPIRVSSPVRPVSSETDKEQRDLVPPPSNSQVSVSSTPPPLRIPFFRWFGPTGIAPGFKRIFVQIKDGSDQQEPQSPSSTKTPLDNLPSDMQRSLKRKDPCLLLFEPDDNQTPSAGVLFPLLEKFFEYYECHFPFYSRDSFIGLARDKKVPALLLNSMCAMAARFSALPVFQGKPAYVRGEEFANKAKHLLVPLLNLPSYDVVASILMIAWMEMATCHDVGIWMYTGMAVRMAEDMGMHKVS